jgi:hypothetical protein
MSDIGGQMSEVSFAFGKFDTFFLGQSAQNRKVAGLIEKCEPGEK